jgi:hypothetical protein
MIRRDFFKRAALAALALVGLKPSWRPPDIWDRRFRADAFDIENCWEVFGCLHPRYTDMVCEKYDARKMFDLGRFWWDIEVGYRRIGPERTHLYFTGGKCIPLYRVGPELPASYVEIAPAAPVG